MQDVSVENYWQVSMGLFDQVLGAIANPSQQGNSDQLGDILGVVQAISANQGIDSNTTQTMLSTVGSYVRSALQQQRQTQGADQAEAIVNQYGSTSPSPHAVNALFSGGQQQQLIQTVAQRTGLNAQQIETLLPILVPIVLNLLKTGTRNANASNAASGSNSVLNSFLDADGDGDVDMGDAMRLAGQYLNQRR